MADERRARVAVVGTGWWSTYTHIPGLKENPHADLVALCDIDPEKVRRAGQKYGVERTYTDLEEMLRREELEGVVVATHHTTHYEVTRRCIEAGLHVMLEKPMVLSAREAWDLVRLARERGVELIIGYPYHFAGSTLKAREVLDSGELGRIQYVYCHMASMVVEFYRGNPEAYRPVFNYPLFNPGRHYHDPRLTGGGQGHLQITHSAGAMFFTTGLRAERVSAFMNNWDVPVDLVDAISVRFEGGAVGIVGSTGNIGVGDAGQIDIGVYCERGYVLMNLIPGKVYVRRHDGREETFGPLPPEDAYPRFATANNLVDVILGRAPNGSPGEVGARVVELLDAAYRSASEDGLPFNVRDL